METSRTHTARWLGLVHRALGWVPFAWLWTFGTVVVFYGWQFGHLPRYGVDPDCNTGPLAWAQFALLLLSVLAVPAWALLTVLFLGLAPVVMRRNAVSIGLCLLGIMGYFVVRQWLPHVFEWVMD